MSQEELTDLQMLSMQFHLLICTKKIGECARCKSALLAKEQLKAKEAQMANRELVVR